MLKFNPNIQSASAFAPATCANVAVGFDLLGFPLENIGDTVTLTLHNKSDVEVAVIGANQSLPLDPTKNLASAVVMKFCHDHKLRCDFKVTVNKGIPIGSGMGGSAASSVAALVALNAFLEKPAPLDILARYAILGEEIASGSKHADNVVPSLFGGLTLTRSVEPLDILMLPIPDLYCVLVNPNLRVDTRDARDALPEKWPLNLFVQQSANLASFIVALYESDYALLRECMQDLLIEPKRAQLIKGFYAVKDAALKHGALAASISGSGPSLFAFCETKETADLVAKHMTKAFNNEKVNATYWISKIPQKGAHIIAGSGKKL